MKKVLTVEAVQKEAAIFGKKESKHEEKSIFGSTDGKAVGTYLEEIYSYDVGNSASGIDFPSLEIDIKVTSIKQPQSSWK